MVMVDLAMMRKNMMLTMTTKMAMAMVEIIPLIVMMMSMMKIKPIAKTRREKMLLPVVKIMMMSAMSADDGYRCRCW